MIPYRTESVHFFVLLISATQWPEGVGVRVRLLVGEFYRVEFVLLGF